MLRPTLLFILGLNGCVSGDETLTGYGAADRIWVLQSMDGKIFPATATIAFPEEGRITGDAPCNAYFGQQTAPYPWFEVKNIGSTKRACPELSMESEFFKALSEMAISEVSTTTLILSNDQKRTMIFTPR